MPDLSNFQYLRRQRITQTGSQALYGAASPDGPWHKLTKRETQIVLALAHAEAAKQTVAPTPHPT